ncbi:hypothetical protein P7C70_g9524, partial [Phenoliferia sp. Uapishka_3]
MDLSSLTTRLTSLSLSPAPSAASTTLQTFFFTPKSGSKHPVNTSDDLKLVVVAIEENKNVGAAKALAASVGLKDMRAIGAADLEKLVGRTRDLGELHLA